MSYLRQKRPVRTYWAELGFLVLGLLGLQPSLFTSLITGAQTKPANYYEPQNPQYNDWVHNTLTGLVAHIQNSGPQHTGTHWSSQPVANNSFYPSTSPVQGSFQNPNWQNQGNYNVSGSQPYGQQLGSSLANGQPNYSSAQQQSLVQQPWGTNGNQWNTSVNSYNYGSSNNLGTSVPGYGNQNYQAPSAWSSTNVGANHSAYSPSLYGQTNPTNYAMNQSSGFPTYSPQIAQHSGNAQPPFLQQPTTPSGYSPQLYGQTGYGQFNSNQNNFNSNGSGNWQRYQPNSGSAYFR
jgi:hypothetical protein